MPRAGSSGPDGLAAEELILLPCKIAATCHRKCSALFLREQAVEWRLAVFGGLFAGSGESAGALCLAETNGAHTGMIRRCIGMLLSHAAD